MGDIPLHFLTMSRSCCIRVTCCMSQAFQIQVVCMMSLTDFVITGSCGGGNTVLGYSGHFSVPSYSNNMQCSWRLSARHGERLFITFTGFSTEKHYDYVEVRDTANTGHVIGRYSGTEIPPVVVSCGRDVSIVFRSDSSVTRSGFTATFLSKSKTTW